MLLFGLLMLFVAAGLSQFFGLAAIALPLDMELPDDMLLPDIVLPDIVFAAALVQLCVVLMALWLLMALPLDMELPLDIELPCAKAWPPISIAAAAVTIRMRDMESSEDALTASAKDRTRAGSNHSPSACSRVLRPAKAFRYRQNPVIAIISLTMRQ
jgi:hypothetical protein